jgi:uncharacterized membrane protein YqjE
MERRINLLEVVRCVTVVSFLVSLVMITITIIHGSRWLVVASVICLAIMAAAMTYWMVYYTLKKSGGESSTPPEPLTPEDIVYIQWFNELPGGPMPL